MDPALRARRLVRRSTRGVISTLSREMPGFPYGSWVEYCTDHQGRPLLLLSALAEHTRNLHHHARASLTAHGEIPAANLMAAPRFTLLGEARLVPEADVPRVRARYLRYCPHVADYLSLDFAFWRIEPARIRNISGFAQAAWVSASDYLALESRLEEVEERILERLNGDEASLLPRIAALPRIPAAGPGTSPAAGGEPLRDLRAIGVDCDGLDLALGHERLRVEFSAPAWDADSVWTRLYEFAAAR